MRRFASLLAVGLAACSPTGGELAAPAPPASAPELKLACAAPFTPEATLASLTGVFGAENIADETRDGMDGEKVSFTAIYPKDPAKRIELTFQNATEHKVLIGAEVHSATSDWMGPGEIQASDTLPVVETANGGPFILSGFGWDYGGYVADWKGGKLAAPAPKCRTVIRFSSDTRDPSIVGESQHSSSELAMQASGAKVQTFSISWEVPPPN